MSFTSFDFLYFVAIFLILYYVLPKKARYLVLLAASYAFYIITCKGYVVYILLTTVTTYFSAVKISALAAVQKDYLKENKESLSKEDKKNYKAKIKKQQKLFLVSALVFNFGILAVLKYADFLFQNINLFKLHVFGSTNFLPMLNLVLPLGISFYIFQSMGYVIDIYYGKYEAEKNFLKVALFVSFFPQIVQGPISRFNELAPSLFEGHDYEEKNITYGLYQIFWGLFKKLLIADRVAGFVSCAMENYQQAGGTYLLLAIFLYSMEIYGDFSGGIDITIGVARLFGVRVVNNFERPFFSKSVEEYWRRWHITLGTWFKDYIFYPLTVAKWMINLGKWCRKHFGDAFGKRVPIYLSMFIVWFTTGLWHGAQWRYIVWGLLNFVILTFSTEAEPLYQKINAALKWNGTFIQRLFRVVRTFWIMSFLRVFDVSTCGMGQAVTVIKKALTDWCPLQMVHIETLGLEEQEFWCAITAIVIVFIVDLIQRKGSIRDRLYALPLAARWTVTALLVIAVVVFGSYGIGYDSRAFIYLQF